MNSMGVRPNTYTGVRFYLLCTSIHQYIEPTAEHTPYRERQRNFTAHHNRTRGPKQKESPPSLKMYFDRPQKHLTLYNLLKHNHLQVLSVDRCYCTAAQNVSRGCCESSKRAKMRFFVRKMLIYCTAGKSH